MPKANLENTFILFLENQFTGGSLIHFSRELYSKMCIFFWLRPNSTPYKLTYNLKNGGWKNYFNFRVVIFRGFSW